MTESKGHGSNPSSVQLIAVPGIPEVRQGDKISSILLNCFQQSGTALEDGDIIAIAHKVVSKAEGRLANLDEVIPGERAKEIAAITQKDPRLVELILSESDEISRVRKGALIVRHRLGFTSANAGIDRSNVPQDPSPSPSEEEPKSSAGEWVVLLPVDPDRSAARIAEEIFDETGVKIGIVIVDSHGRPFRLGTVGVAIGVYGVPALWDRRGETDRYGYLLQHTEVGTADEIAAAASLLMGQADEGQPAVLLRGVNLPKISGKAEDLVRSKDMDLYR
jgi:coenzyme F420-0:L-glutamate ligase/coenzyme F420-1:gamma-L-glutamate ligase